MKRALILIYLFFAAIATDTIAQETILFPSDLEDAEHFGRRVMTHGDYIIVGSLGSEEKVYIFKKTADDWVEEAILKTVEPSITNCFGCSLAAYGDYILIGAPGTIGLDGLLSPGAAYVFKKEGNQWVEKTNLTPSDFVESQGFGSAVSLYEDYAIIGSSRDDIDGLFSSGSAYIFKKQGEQWIEQTKLIPFDPTDQASFGFHVSINEEFAFVGATRAFNADGIRTGAVYTYKRSGEDWTAQSKLTPSDGIEVDVFYKPIVLGNRLLVGSTNSPIYNDIGKGAGYIYIRDGDDWVEADKLTPNEDLEGDLQLKGMGFSSNYVALASSFNVDCAPVHLYRLNETENSWTKVNVLKSLGQENERYGHDVFLSDNYMVVGAAHTYYHYSDSDSTFTGAVYVYDLNTLVSEEEILKTSNVVSLTPNPATQVIRVDVANTSYPISDSELELYDTNGRLLKTYSGKSLVSESSWELDISNLTSGVYFFRIASTTQGAASKKYFYSGRFIKN